MADRPHHQRVALRPRGLVAVCIGLGAIALAAWWAADIPPPAPVLAPTIAAPIDSTAEGRRGPTAAEPSRLAMAAFEARLWVDPPRPAPEPEPPPSPPPPPPPVKLELVAIVMAPPATSSGDPPPAHTGASADPTPGPAMAYLAAIYDPDEDTLIFAATGDRVGPGPEINRVEIVAVEHMSVTYRVRGRQGTWVIDETKPDEIIADMDPAAASDTRAPDRPRRGRPRRFP